MRYTEAQKARALQALAQADITAVSAEMGIPVSTLRRWWSHTGPHRRSA